MKPGTESGAKPAPQGARLFLPLYGRLLGYVAATIALTLALYSVLPGRQGLGWKALLTEPVRARLLGIGSSLIGEIAASGGSAQAWQQVLDDYSAKYGVRFSLSARRLQPNELPPRDATSPPPDFVHPPLFEKPMFPAVIPPPPPEHGAATEGLVKLESADGVYRLRLSVFWPGWGQAPNGRVEVLATSNSLRAMLSLLGVTDWVVFAALLLVATSLLWAPFVFGMTYTVLTITEATREIARGRFHTRVRSRRHDELGQLAESINTMAERLQSHVEDQKQFLSDVAHEVTSPLARMRIALGLLEPRLHGDEQQLLRDIEDEVQQMASMLDELLLYTRADLSAGPPQLAPVELSALIAEVLGREDPQRHVRTDIEPGLVVLALPPMLARAIANLVRNALRHAVDAEIKLSALEQGGNVWVRVADRGPGVPETALARLGEPFFRPSAARSRDTGGTGLGLAIVRRCVANCGGSVRFRNREGGGFEAEIRIMAAPPTLAAAQ